ncbi:MAG TPA: transglutaminase domain-containing protein [Polyangia bacterium]|nr:transglutaminase domain-containing protein [Polyangia bacterium]
MRLGSALIEHTTVRAERVLAETGMLLHGSLVVQDQVSAQIHLVGFDGDRWDRLVEKRDSVLDPISADPVPIDLERVEVLGLALLDRLARVASGEVAPDTARPFSFYEPGLPAPITMRIAGPAPGHTEIDGQRIEGVLVEAIRNEGGEILMSALFDDHGQLWEERYPALGEVRRRSPGPVSLSSETSELLVGLRSPTYLGMPDSAERAVFSLRLPDERVSVLEPLGAPVNQTLTRAGAGELRLEVVAGAPDGDYPPRPEDLAPTRYIRPDAPEIHAALKYLRTAGRKGSLPPVRSDNATPVIARSALIADPASFWRDPAQVAGLMMNYVSALLPDKRHTFSMADAVAALERGAGDCTEHAVLFASLMRAHGIPTRLVAGLYLTRGGLWGYHLWNEYWDKNRWRSIDPGNMVYRPGALYVAFSRGTSRFDDVRSDLATFIERTFRGVSFELTEAFGSGGERMILSRPLGNGEGLPETALFNALVLAGRGDHAAALAALETVIDGNVGSIRLALTRIQLLVAAGRHDLALAEIATLRHKTSAPDNVQLLDVLELDALVALGRTAEARPVLERISGHLAADPARLTLIRARFLAGTGAAAEALELLRAAIFSAPDDASLRVAFATTVAALDVGPDLPLLQEALDHGREALLLTLSAESSALVAVAALFFRAGRFEEAALFVDHGLILTPASRDLLDLRDRLRSDRCSD